MRWALLLLIPLAGCVNDLAADPGLITCRDDASRDPVHVSGRVTDSEDGPVEGAVVAVGATAQDTTTDERGMWSTGTYKSGCSYRLTIRDGDCLHQGSLHAGSGFIETRMHC